LVKNKVRFIAGFIKPCKKGYQLVCHSAYMPKAEKNAGEFCSFTCQKGLCA